MRNTLLTSAALLGIVLAAPSFAQSGSDASSSAAGSTSTGPAGHEPVSTHAANIDRADTRSVIAPALPAPHLGRGASPESYMRAAERALDRHRTGEAQAALEMAETRLLDRSIDPQQASLPDQSPEIRELTEARRRLARGDIPGAREAIRTALSEAPPGFGGTTGTGNSGQGMGSQGMGSQSGGSEGAGAAGAGQMGGATGGAGGSGNGGAGMGGGGSSGQ